MWIYFIYCCLVIFERVFIGAWWDIQWSVTRSNKVTLWSQSSIRSSKPLTCNLTFRTLMYIRLRSPKTITAAVQFLWSQVEEIQYFWPDPFLCEPMLTDPSTFLAFIIHYHGIDIPRSLSSISASIFGTTYKVLNIQPSMFTNKQFFYGLLHIYIKI